MKPPPWKVGELARRTGLSVRALHHYDEVGLFRPSIRTSAGHRLYARADVERLQQIQSLRLMGVSLDEVKRLLDGATLSPRDVIALQLGRLKEQITAQTRLVERLTALAIHLDRAELPLEELCHIIEAMTTMEKYFTTDQLEVLRERRTNVGEERQREVQDAWAEIIPKVQTAMDQGVDPTSPEMLGIARRWRALVNEFTGGDPAIAGAVRTMYEQEGPAIREKMGKAVPTPEMFPYMAKAFAALRDEGGARPG